MVQHNSTAEAVSDESSTETTVDERRRHDWNISEIRKKIMDDGRYIKYTTYRVAAKFAALSKTLFTNNIPYEMISGILELHSLQHTDSAPLIRSEQLLNILHDIFFAADKKGFLQSNEGFVSVDVTARVLANFLWAIFDSAHITPLSLLELKQTFLLISHTPTYDRLIHEHFLLAADHNLCVSRFRFATMVSVMAKLFAFIDPTPDDEVTTNPSSTTFFSLPIAALLTDCFVACPGLVGLNKFQFYTLWRRAPFGALSFGHYANVYALVGRMAAAERLDVQHVAETCAGCGDSPVRGLGFRCAQCRKLTLCFRCFGDGYEGGEKNRQQHVRTHRMYELSATAMQEEHSPRRVFRAFLQKLCNMFAMRRDEERLSSKPLNSTIETNVIEIDPPSMVVDRLNGTEKQQNDLNANQHSNELSLSCTSLPPFDRIATILTAFEQHTRTLTTWIEQKESEKNASDLQFLHKHQTGLRTLIAELQHVQQQQQQGSLFRGLPPCSTPYRRSMKNRCVASSSSDSLLTHSIHGIELNQTYVEANRTDLSAISELSTWIHLKRQSGSSRSSSSSNSNTAPQQPSRVQLPTVSENVALDVGMVNFKELLQTVRTILDDSSHTDNEELAKVTGQFESMLNHVIDAVEKKNNGLPSESIDTYV